jgi:FdhD protein
LEVGGAHANVSESVKEHEATRWRGGAVSRDLDSLAVEEPLEIRLAGRRFTLTMRTPGHDQELAAGFLLAEGFVAAADELDEIRPVIGPTGAAEENAIDVILRVPAARLRERLKRNFVMSSSCGVCGKTSIEAIERRIAPIEDRVRISSSAILKLPAIMREAQALFSATGGLHAAALFELPEPHRNGAKNGDAPPPTLTVLREDVGRHNAVDKVVGYSLLRGMVPLSRAVMMVSGRTSFEIVQKVAAAGVPILCAVSAPSSLAVELAQELGVTLVGFLREPNFNVYACAERIVA